MSLLELEEAPLVKSWEIRRQLLDQALEVEDIEPTYRVTGIRLAQGGAEWDEPEPGAALALAPLIGEDLARRGARVVTRPCEPRREHQPPTGRAPLRAVERGSRRILRTLSGEFEQALARMTVFRPELVWRTRGHLLTRFIAVERLLATSLPTATWEGERLLQAVFQRFQLGRLLATTRYTQARFERRLGVVEQQYIIAAAVFTFLANSTIDIIY